MKTRHFSLLVFVLGAVLAFVAPRGARAAEGVSFDFFYDSLDPYGQWVEVPEYGYCWHPAGVDADWAPYSDGYWAYTDAGWTWVSYEDWGAITYHYGRWLRLNDLGWCWVPGYEWGPAWVSWRSSDEYIGWAPLPPEVVFSEGAGISIWVDVTYGIGPGYYNFCRFRDFGAPALRPCIINRGQNIIIINSTVNITNITVNPHRHLVFNGGPDFRLVQGRSAHPIQTLKLVQQTDVNAAKASGNGFFAKQHGNQLDVLAPVIIKPVAGEKPRPKNISKVESAANLDKGWSHVPDAQAKQLRSKFKEESRDLTPETAHAKPVTDKDLRVVTENSKPVSTPPPRVLATPVVRNPEPQPGATVEPVVSTPAPRGKTRKPMVTATPPPAVMERTVTPAPQMKTESYNSNKTLQTERPIREKTVDKQRVQEEHQPQQFQKQPFYPQAQPKQTSSGSSDKTPRKKSKDEKDPQQQ